MFVAQFVPVILLLMWQHHDDVQGFAVFAKPFDGAHQNGLAAHTHKLLGYLTAHSQAFAACYYDDIIHIRLLFPHQMCILHFALQCLHLFVADEERQYLVGIRECCCGPFAGRAA